MNWWVYLGYGSICLIGILLFVLVFIGIFVCIDNYYDDKKENKDDES